MDAAVALDPLAGRQELTPEECQALLGAIGWGILAVAEPPRPHRAEARRPGAVAGARPFAVPVAYALHEGTVYVATTVGRKLRALEQNPRLCLTVTDVATLEQWRSVVLTGRARWLDDVGARGAALQAFATQPRFGRRALAPADARRLLAARIFSIEVDEVRGARRGAAPPVGVPAGGVSRGAAAAPPAVIVPDELTRGASPDADAARTMESLRRLVRALRAASAAAERDVGVSGAQLFVLRQLAAAPGSSIGALARLTLTSPSTVSEVVTRLVAHGLVRREAASDDRRRVRLALTARGAAVLGGAPTPVQERLVGALAMLPDAERHALAATLERWLAVAGLADEVAEMFFEGAE